MAKPEDKPQAIPPFHELTAQIAARLRGVCTAMSDDEFGALVTDIARMKLRFAEIEALAYRDDPIDRESEHRLGDAIRRKSQPNA